MLFNLNCPTKRAAEQHTHGETLRLARPATLLTATLKAPMLSRLHLVGRHLAGLLVALLIGATALPPAPWWFLLMSIAVASMPVLLGGGLTLMRFLPSPCIN